MDFKPRYIEETSESTHNAKILSEAAIVYPRSLVDHLSLATQVQLFDHLEKLKVDDLIEDARSYGVATRQSGFDTYFIVTIGMIDIDTARVWDLEEITQDSFLDLVTIKRAIL